MAIVVGVLAAFAGMAQLVAHPVPLELAATVNVRDLLPGIMLMGLVGGVPQALTYDELQGIANPQLAKEPQAIRWTYYDTDEITTAVTRNINYFTQARANKNLTNFPAIGQLTAGQYFKPSYLGFDLLVGVSETADNTGTAQDIQNIMLQSNPVFTVTYNSKGYGPFPLSFLHTSGGAVGAVATGTADTIQLANNGVTDGGWNWGGGLLLAPSVQFSVVVEFETIPVIVTGPLKAKFWMEGTLYRNVS